MQGNFHNCCALYCDCPHSANSDILMACSWNWLFAAVNQNLSVITSYFWLGIVKNQIPMRHLQRVRKIWKVAVKDDRNCFWFISFPLTFANYFDFNHETECKCGSFIRWIRRLDPWAVILLGQLLPNEKKGIFSKVLIFLNAQPETYNGGLIPTVILFLWLRIN